MKLLILVTALVFLATNASAGAASGQFASQAMSTSSTVPMTGTGLLVGFPAGNAPALGWILKGNGIDIDTTSASTTSYAGAIGSEETPQHESRHYAKASIEPVPSTRPAENGKEFWMMVTPTLRDPTAGFSLTGPVDLQETRSQSSFYFHSDTANPNPGFLPEPATPDDWRGVDRSNQEVLEMTQSAAMGSWTVNGSFVVSIFQADFTATNADGEQDHYSTGDGDPHLPPTTPIYSYSQVRADITVKQGSLELHANGRPIQVDLANLRTTINGRLVLSGASGTLQQGSRTSTLAGTLSFDTDSLDLATTPHDGQFDSTFTGSVRSVQVNGVPLQTQTAVRIPEPTPTVALLSGMAFLVAMGLAALAIRRRPDRLLRIAQAQAFFEVGKLAACLRICKGILRRIPGDVDATTLATMSLVRMGKVPEAQRLLQASLEHSSDTQGLLSLVEALVLFHLGDAAAAAECLEAALALHPGLQEEMVAVDLLDQLRLQQPVQSSMRAKVTT